MVNSGKDCKVVETVLSLGGVWKDDFEVESRFKG